MRTAEDSRLRGAARINLFEPLAPSVAAFPKTMSTPPTGSGIRDNHDCGRVGDHLKIPDQKDQADDTADF
jgi:hypothetical protein